jgi:GNAT superfamily N-acetyltransferase
MAAVEIQYRQCLPADAAILALIGASTFLEAYAGWIPGDAIVGHCFKNHTEAAYAHYLAQPTTRAWLAEAAPGAAPIGYALLTEPDFAPELLHPGDAELKRIYVFSRFHRGPRAAEDTGSTSQNPAPGQALMNLAIAHAKSQRNPRLLLGLHRDNARALRFYQKNGFAPIGTRTFQVGTHIFDDLVLAKPLPAATKKPGH